MPAFPRDELDAMWQEWIEANRIAQDKGDWTGLADLYAADATYGWMYAPDEHFMAVGREQIRRMGARHRDARLRRLDLPVRVARSSTTGRGCASASGGRCRP